jgi:hypothetical protein
MKRTTFKQPRQAAPVAADEWVKGATPGASGELARLTIDLPIELRDRFKAACAIRRTKMVEEVRRFIEDWVQKHGNP